jgi:hypothetical protein
VGGLCGSCDARVIGVRLRYPADAHANLAVKVDRASTRGIQAHHRRPEDHASTVAGGTLARLDRRVLEVLESLFAVLDQGLALLPSPEFSTAVVTFQMIDEHYRGADGHDPQASRPAFALALWAQLPDLKELVSLFCHAFSLC